MEPDCSNVPNKGKDVDSSLSTSDLTRKETSLVTETGVSLSEGKGLDARELLSEGAPATDGDGKPLVASEKRVTSSPVAKLSAREQLLIDLGLSSDEEDRVPHAPKDDLVGSDAVDYEESPSPNSDSEDRGQVSHDTVVVETSCEPERLVQEEDSEGKSSISVALAPEREGRNLPEIPRSRHAGYESWDRTELLEREVISYKDFLVKRKAAKQARRLGNSGKAVLIPVCLTGKLRTSEQHEILFRRWLLSRKDAKGETLTVDTLLDERNLRMGFADLLATKPGAIWKAINASKSQQIKAKPDLSAASGGKRPGRQERPVEGKPPVPKWVGRGQPISPDTGCSRAEHDVIESPLSHKTSLPEHSVKGEEEPSSKRQCLASADSLEKVRSDLESDFGELARLRDQLLDHQRKLAAAELSRAKLEIELLKLQSRLSTAELALGDHTKEVDLGKMYWKEYIQTELRRALKSPHRRSGGSAET